MKILIHVCIACLISVLYVSNIQGQIKISMEVVPMSSHCFQVTAQTVDVSDVITLHGNDPSGRTGTEFVLVTDTSTCEATLCFDESTSNEDYPNGCPEIFCRVSQGEADYFDGCAIIIDPS